MGKIPPMNIIAGNVLPFPAPPSNFIKCKNCSLYFKWPRIRKEQLDSYYQNGNPNNWQYELKTRKDW